LRLLPMGLMTVAVAAAGHPQQPAGTSQSGVSAPQAMITQYCVGCHNDKLKSGDLSLSAINVDNAGENPEVWEKVVRKLRSHMMPPPGRPRPDEKTYDDVAASLEKSLDRAAAANPDPGRTETFRRLNRTEYRNAIHDLLSLDVDVAPFFPRTTPVSASITSESAACRRLFWSDTLRPHRRSAVSPSGLRCALRARMLSCFRSI